MMAELKPIEVVMRIDFASSNGIEIVAHAERVCELVRCKDCVWHGEKYGDNYCGNFNVWGFKDGDYCSLGRRRETEDEHDL